MNQNPAGLPANRKIKQDVFIDRVVIVKIVRAELVEPVGLAGVDVAILGAP